MKGKPKKQITAVSPVFYIVLSIASLALIVLFAFVQACEAFSLCAVLEKLLEFMAAGMLPAVLLALLTDIVTTKHQNVDFKKRILAHKKQLKNLCLDLPSEILVCLNTPDYAEDGKERTFVEWCEQLSNDKNKISAEAEYYSFYLHEIEKEASTFCGYLNTFGEGMPDAIRLPELQKAENLRRISQRLYNMLKQRNRKSIDHKRFIQDIAHLNDAVLKMFTETNDKSKTELVDPEISKYYKGKYNSETYAEEGDNMS